MLQASGILWCTPASLTSGLDKVGRGEVGIEDKTSADTVLLSGAIPAPEGGKAVFLHLFRISGSPDFPTSYSFHHSSWLTSPQILPRRPGEALGPGGPEFRRLNAA